MEVRWRGPTGRRRVRCAWRCCPNRNCGRPLPPDAHRRAVHTNTYTHMYTHIRAHIHTHIRTHTRTHKRTHTHTHSAYTYNTRRRDTYTRHTFIRTHTPYVHTYTQTHTNTHTSSKHKLTKHPCSAVSCFCVRTHAMQCGLCVHTCAEGGRERREREIRVQKERERGRERGREKETEKERERKKEREAEQEGTYRINGMGLQEEESVAGE